MKRNFSEILPYEEEEFESKAPALRQTRTRIPLTLLQELNSENTEYTMSPEVLEEEISKYSEESLCENLTHHGETCWEKSVFRDMGCNKYCLQTNTNWILVAILSSPQDCVIPETDQIVIFPSKNTTYKVRINFHGHPAFEFVSIRWGFPVSDAANPDGFIICDFGFWASIHHSDETADIVRAYRAKLEAELFQTNEKIDQVRPGSYMWSFVWRGNDVLDTLRLFYTLLVSPTVSQVDSADVRFEINLCCLPMTEETDENEPIALLDNEIQEALGNVETVEIPAFPYKSAEWHVERTGELFQPHDTISLITHAKI